MTKENVLQNYGFCSTYLDKLNNKQVDAVWEYLNMAFKKRMDILPKEHGRAAVLHTLIKIKEGIEEGDTVHNYSIFTTFSEIWHIMVGMLLVQDEYNKYNPNYKSKVK